MSERLVIAHVLSSFGVGGQERVALDLARTQVEAGHEVLAVSLARPPEGPCAALFRDAGVRAETVAKRWRVDPSLPIRLGRHLARAGVSVVHTHNPHALIYGAPAAFVAGAVIVAPRLLKGPTREEQLKRLLSDAYREAERVRDDAPTWNRLSEWVKSNVPSYGR